MMSACSNHTRSPRQITPGTPSSLRRDEQSKDCVVEMSCLLCDQSHGYPSSDRVLRQLTTDCLAQPPPAFATQEIASTFCCQDQPNSSQQPLLNRLRRTEATCWPVGKFHWSQSDDGCVSSTSLNPSAHKPANPAIQDASAGCRFFLNHESSLRSPDRNGAARYDSPQREPSTDCSCLQSSAPAPFAFRSWSADTSATAQCTHRELWPDYHSQCSARWWPQSELSRPLAFPCSPHQSQLDHRTLSRPSY